MQNARLSARIIPATELDSSQIAAWEQICADYPHLNSPFYSPHYTGAVASVRPLVYVCELEAGTRTVGFFPFQFRNRWSQILGSAERVGEEMTDYFGLISAPDLQCEQRQILRLAGLNYFLFSHLPESQRHHGLPAERPCLGLVLRFDQTYWDDLRAVKPKLVNETDRLARKLESRYGPLRFCFNEPNWELPLRNLIRFKGDQYVRTGRPNLFTERWKRDLLRTLAALTEPSCRGVFSTLYAGDTWVAFHFGLRNKDTLHYWFPVYNQEVQAYSPGRQLEKLIIQHGPAEGIRVLDRGAGDSYSKRCLCNEEHLFYRGVWCRSGLRSSLARGVWSVKWRLDTFAARCRAAR